MSRATSRPCPHDLRPGTTVCLHCRREANLERRARLQRRVLKVATGVSVAIVGAIAVALFGIGRSAAGPVLPGRRPAVSSVVPQGRPVATAPVRAPDSVRAGSLSVASTTSATAAGAPSAPSAPSAPGAPLPAVASGAAALTSAPHASAPAVVPVIPEGRHRIDAAIFAERTGDTVVVHFDTPDTRTRRPEKFERTVRETLPAVYGALADSMLATVPEGRLAAGGDLLTELPERGIRLAAPNGAAVTLWPETRPGEDGPLVVTYRVVPTR